MKKLLGIIVLGLLLSGNILSAKTINIENKIQLDVPISHGFIKIDRDSALNSGALSGLEEFLDELDDLALNFYVVGPKRHPGKFLSEVVRFRGRAGGTPEHHRVRAVHVLVVLELVRNQRERTVPACRFELTLGVLDKWRRQALITVDEVP